MKRITIFILAVSSLLFACKKDAVQTVNEKTKPSLKEALSILRASAEKASMAAGNQANPVDITQEKKGNQVTKQWRSDLTAYIEIVPDPCGSDDFTIQVIGTGNALHLGRYTSIGTFCANTAIQEGAMTAANGDKVFFSLVSLGGFGVGAIWVYDITGGTGQFEGASGRFDVVFSAFGENDVFISESTGTITY